MLIDVKGYDEKVIAICPKGTVGDIIEDSGLFIALPKQPNDKDILYHNLPKEEQRWVRKEMPPELLRIRDMDEWRSMSKEFKAKYSPYIEEEFRRRAEGLWFFNNGEPTYIVGSHYNVYSVVPNRC